MITIRQTVKNLEFKGRNLPASILISWCYDLNEPEGMPSEEPEATAYRSQFDAGHLINGKVRVIAQALDCSATDHVGGVHLRAAFLDADVMDAVALYDMVETACARLLEEIESRAWRWADVVDLVRVHAQGVA